MDVFVAAKMAKSGTIIGVDMTPEQLEKSEVLCNKYKFKQVFFRKGYIENLSISSGSIDTVISNGVINLSAEKERVFEEVSRVLKPGGRLAISDIVTSIELPDSISCNATLWAACIGGAIPQYRYIAIIEAAGMEVVEVKENPYAFISNSAKGATKSYGIKSVSILAQKK
jgi:ubiquinone/menaquinone biosynthesis C-methylase UbiE